MNGVQVIICRSTPVAPDPRVERAARALATENFVVTVVAWDRGWKLPCTEQREDFRLIRIRVPAPFGRGLRNLPGLLRWQGALFGWLLKNRGCYDIIHACDLDTALPGLLAAKIIRKQLVFDIFDSYPDSFRVGPLRRLVRQMEGWVVAHADAVIIADEVRQEQLGNIWPKRLVVIYNSPPELRLKPDNCAKAGGFKIAYVGLLDATRGLFTLLDVVARRPEWKFDLAGFGVDEERIIRQASSLPNVRFHGRVDYRTALQLMARADVLMATYDPAVPNHRYASPNKLFEGMMLEKPVVAARGTHIDELVERHRCGLVVPYGNIEALVAALDRLATDPAFRRALGAAGRQAYDTFYSWDRMQTRLLSLYREITTESD